jgi:hypothetical protein
MLTDTRKVDEMRPTVRIELTGTQVRMLCDMATQYAENTSEEMPQYEPAWLIVDAVEKAFADLLELETT